MWIVNRMQSFFRKGLDMKALILVMILGIGISMTSCETFNPMCGLKPCHGQFRV